MKKPLQPFDFQSNPSCIFGAGRHRRLPDLVDKYGKSLLLLSGSGSFIDGPFWPAVKNGIEKQGIKIRIARITSEPSPVLVDDIVRSHAPVKIDVVAAIGGGSVLDAGKAVSAMLTRPVTESVFDYLEGVGNQTHPGTKLPFIAVPTTSGTGSEATKNAVLSQTGANGFKKSLRHDAFIPDMALVDPELTLACPVTTTAACGMDALTQLIESFVSVQAGPMTDALCIAGLAGFGDALTRICLEDPEDIHARSVLSLGAYLSGLTLANAGLGIVHGLASVIGGRFDIPHGVVCGTLLAETSRMIIEALLDKRKSGGESDHGILKYAQAGRVLCGTQAAADPVDDCLGLVSFLRDLTDRLNLPPFGPYGMQKKDIPGIGQGCGAEKYAD